MKIDDITFFRFANNLLDKDGMANTAKALHEAGEMDAVLHSSVIAYEANTALADEMLGIDCETMNAEIIGTEKNILEKDRIVVGDLSKEVTNITRSKLDFD